MSSASEMLLSANLNIFIEDVLSAHVDLIVSFYAMVPSLPVAAATWFECKFVLHKLLRLAQPNSMQGRLKTEYARD